MTYRKKVHRRTFVVDIIFLAARPPSYIITFRLFCLLSPFYPLQCYVEKNFCCKNGVCGRGVWRGLTLPALAPLPPPPSIFGPANTTFYLMSFEIRFCPFTLTSAVITANYCIICETHKIMI